MYAVCEGLDCTNQSKSTMASKDADSDGSFTPSDGTDSDSVHSDHDSDYGSEEENNRYVYSRYDWSSTVSYFASWQSHSWEENICKCLGILTDVGKDLQWVLCLR